MKTDGLIIEAFRPLSQTPLHSLLRNVDHIENDSIFSQFQPFLVYFSVYSKTLYSANSNEMPPINHGKVGET